MDTLPEEQNNKNILPEGMSVTLFGKSDELPQNDTKEEIDAIFLEERSPTCRKLSKKQQKATLRRVNRVRVKTRNILPVSSKDLTQILVKNLGLGEFMVCILCSVFHISPHYHCALLILGPSIIGYRAQVLTAQLVFKLGDSSKATTQSSLLSLGEAFTKFFPQIIDIMTIMQCYVLVLWLVCPLHPVLQISIVFVLIVTPCYYVPGLVGPASGVGVSSFKVPLIWFTVLAAMALSLVFVFLTLLMIYLIRRYVHPRVKEDNFSLDALSD